MNEVEIGNAVRKARSGRSQVMTALAMQQAGHPWHQNTVTNVETGRRPLRLSEALTLVVIFGTTLGELVGERDYDLRIAKRELRAAQAGITRQIESL